MLSENSREIEAYPDVSGISKAVRRALWDKTKKLKALSLKKVVPTFVPEADETRHGVTWRHSARDGAENWRQLE
mgnify:FL=1